MTDIEKLTTAYCIVAPGSWSGIVFLYPQLRDEPKVKTWDFFLNFLSCKLFIYPSFTFSDCNGSEREKSGLTCLPSFFQKLSIFLMQINKALLQFQKQKKCFPHVL